MSFHPEGEKGFKEGERCPYCGSSNIRFICDDKREEYGISAFFYDSDGVCEDCGRKIRIVEAVDTWVYGCYAADEKEYEKFEEEEE